MACVGDIRFGELLFRSGDRSSPGKGFSPEEEQPGSAPIVVLSYRCWQRLGSDPKLIGEFLSVNGTDCQVVGVAPEGFTGVTLAGSDLWLPLGSFRTVDKFARSKPNWEPWFYVVGRLKPEMTIPVAQTQLQTLFPHFKPECIKDNPSSNPSINLRPPGRMRLPGDLEQSFWLYTKFSLVLITASAIILVIACLNLANMLIVQGASRHREIAVRMAIGGGRWRIIRQLLVESLLLAVLGGVLGILLAFCGMRILNVWIADADMVQDLQPGLNVRVLAATLGFCLMATLLFGLRPALWLSKRDIAGEMKGSTGHVLGSLRRKRGGLSVAGQIALAVALVLSATLLTQSTCKKRGRIRVSAWRTSWSSRSIRNRPGMTGSGASRRARPWRIIWRPCRRSRRWGFRAESSSGAAGGG